MKIEDYPNLLIASKLAKPIEVSCQNINESKDHLNSDIEKVFLHGIFVMSVSSMEVMTSDVLKYYLKNFPQKLPSSEFKYNKDDFFGNYFNLLEKTIENHVNSLSYKSFEEYFKKFLEYLSIEWDDFQESFGKYIQEIKASRNLLLHNNLIVNDQYIERAGDAIRSSSKGDQLKIDYEYVIQSIDKILEFETKLKELITEKYREYTKIHANKRLWKFMFKPPVMPYDDFWRYDESSDHISATKKGYHEEGLSGTETILLGLWRAHFTGSGHHMKHFHMRRFDRLNQEKVMFFLSIAQDFSFE